MSGYNPLTNLDRRGVLVGVVAVLLLVPAASGVATAAGATSVSITPTDGSIDVGQTTTFDVVVNDAQGGVGASEFSVAVDNSVAEITDVDVLGGGATSVDIADDGSSAEIEYAFRDTADTGAVTVTEVTVEGVSDGSTAVSLGAAAGNDGVLVFDEGGTGYDVTGTNDATLSVAGDEPTPEPANFAVSNLQAPGSVTQGDAIDLSADLTNTGGQAATKTVEFRADTDGDGSIADESAVASQDIQLAGGESTTVEFTDIDTDSLPSGTVTHGVATPDSSTTAEIDIEQPPSPETTVRLEPADQSTTVGETVTYDVIVADGQGGVGAAELRVSVDDVGIATVTDAAVFGSGETEIDVAGDDSHVDMEYAFRDTADTGPVTIAEVTVQGASEGSTEVSLGPAAGNDAVLIFDESGTGYDVTGTNGATLSVAGDEPTPEPANFEVSGLDAPGSTTAGDAIDVSADVTNTGDEEGTQTIEFGIDLDGDGTFASDELLASEEVTLAGGEDETVQFSDLDTSGLDAGDYTHGVFTDDDSATATITIEEPAPDPANFEVSDLEAPDSATQGDAIDVSADITNTGEEEGTQTVEFRLDVDGDGTLQSDEALASEDLTLPAGENQTVTFSDLDTSGLEAGDYTHGVVTDNESTTATITIEAPDTIGPIGNFESPPADPDDEGLYEDVNGDGTFDVVDVQALFNNLDDDIVQEYTDAFDFNGDGNVDVVDVQKLFNEVN